MAGHKDKDAYQDTCDRLEPDIAMIDAGAGWASCSVSLRRIADTLVWFKGLVFTFAVLYVGLLVIRVVLEYAVLR